MADIAWLEAVRADSLTTGQTIFPCGSHEWPANPGDRLQLLEHWTAKKGVSSSATKGLLSNVTAEKASSACAPPSLKPRPSSGASCSKSAAGAAASETVPSKSGDSGPAAKLAKTPLASDTQKAGASKAKAAPKATLIGHLADKWAAPP